MNRNKELLKEKVGELNDFCEENNIPSLFVMGFDSDKGFEVLLAAGITGTEELSATDIFEMFLSSMFRTLAQGLSKEDGVDCFLTTVGSAFRRYASQENIDDEVLKRLLAKSVLGDLGNIFNNSTEETQH